MNKEQIAKLKELAQASLPEPGETVWFQTYQFSSLDNADAEFICAVSPAAMLELIAKVQTPLHEHNARFAIDGAMWKGHEGVDPPPTEDHWLMPYWKMARELAEFKAAAERTTSPVLVEEFSTHEVIGKIIDQMSQLQMLWGLNEPGALVRFREVSDVLFAASRACRAPVAAAAPHAQAEPVQLGPDWRAIAEGHALQACYLQEKFDGLLAEMEKLPVKGGGYYIRRDAAIALFEHRVSYVSTNDLISAIVDRDTPPNSRNEVVDHDIRGNPITRAMVGIQPQEQVEIREIQCTKCGQYGLHICNDAQATQQLQDKRAALGAALKIVEAVRKDGDPAFAHLLQDFDATIAKKDDAANFQNNEGEKA